MTADLDADLAPATLVAAPLVAMRDITIRFPGVLALIYSGYVFARMSWMFGETSVYSPASIPIYQLKALIPVAGVVLALQGFSEVVRCWRCIRTGAWPARYQDVEEMESAILHHREDEMRHGVDDRHRHDGGGPDAAAPRSAGR